jgi:non-ribosomal peptide synthetase component F
MPEDEESWIAAERNHALDYLREQGVAHLGVGEYPAFHFHPYLALWAVQSKTSPGWVGWWVITGDLPADYISSDEGQHPREALRAFARHWREVAGFMLRGEPHPDYSIGSPEQWPELGDFLRQRAAAIMEIADDDENWIDTDA